MSAQRLRLVLSGLLGLSVLAFIVIAYLGSTQLSHKSQKLVDLKLQSKVADDQLASLAKAKKEVQKYAYFNAIAKSVIPSDKDQARAVLDIFQLANESGIAIASITFPASTLGVSATQNSATTATPQNVISQAKPVEGISGLYGIELTITPQSGPAVPAEQQVTYPKLLDFLSRIEHNRRTAQITQVNIQPASGNNFINFTLTTNIFIKP